MCNHDLTDRSIFALDTFFHISMRIGFNADMYVCRRVIVEFVARSRSSNETISLQFVATVKMVCSVSPAREKKKQNEICPMHQF